MKITPTKFEANNMTNTNNMNHNMATKSYTYEQQKRQERKEDKNLRSLRKSKKGLWVAHSERTE